MSRRAVALAAVVSGGVLVVSAMALNVVNVAQDVVTADVVTDVVLLPVAVSLGILGPLIVSRQPENPIGMLFSVDLLLAGVTVFADSYAAPATHAGGPPRPLDEYAAWIAGFAWVPIVLTLLVTVPILFPSGHPVSRLWQRAERFVRVEIVVTTLGLAFAPGMLEGYPIENPVTPPPHALWRLVSIAGLTAFILCVALGAVAIAARYRSARGIERQQLRWLVFGASVAACVFPLAFVLGLAGWSESFNFAVPLGLTSVILAEGAAILRYRLFDIDRLISRTLSYASLTVILGAAYAGLVLAGQAVFSTFAGGSDLAVAVSTLVVAGLFLPLRSRVQRFVDRRFYRRRYDAQRTLDAFGLRLRQQVDLVVLSADLLGAVGETMEPAHMTLWLRGAE